MRTRTFFLLPALALASCVTAPPGPSPAVVEREVVGSVLKELCRAVINIRGAAKQGSSAAINEHFFANDGWIVEIETSLSTSIEGTVSPSATLLGPIIPGLLVPKGGTPGSFNVVGSAIFDQTATTLRDGKRYIVLETLMNSPELCPQRGGPEYLEYYRDGIAYNNSRKYLAGPLGIREWLGEAVLAQDFKPVISPTTTVSEGAPQSDSIQQQTVTSHNLQMVLLKQLSQPLTAEEKAAKCTFPITTHTIPAIYWSVGQLVSGLNMSMPFASRCPLSYSMSDFSPAATWLKITKNGPAFTLSTASPIPTAGNGTFTSTLTATVTDNPAITQKTTLTVVVNTAPKATSWGPVYGGTFTFVIKATGQLGPSFSFDKSKGGAPTLFSAVRTETNYVNIVMTAVGLPLIEVDQAGNMVATTGVPGTVDLIDKAMLRLDNTLLKLNNAQIGVPQ